MTLLLILVGVLAAVLVLAVVALLLHVVIKAAHARPGASGGGHGAVDRVVLGVLTRVIRVALRAGVRLGPMVMLTVRGRTSGLPRSNPVDLWQHGSDHYLVATHDDTAAWVRNLRAAGEGSARLGRRRWRFTAVELPTQEAGEVLRTVLGPRMRRPVAGFVLRQTLAVPPDASAADFAAAAARHPVFLLTITGGPGRPASAPTAAARPATAQRPRLPVVLIALGLVVAVAHLCLGLAHLLDAAGWVSGVAIGLVVAGVGNHLRIFGEPRAAGSRPGGTGSPV